jgi:indolepyruvate ferredoxin oxidoreductase beta subunit
MSDRTEVLMNERPVALATLTQRGVEYPELGTILQRVRGVTERVHTLDARSIAERAGSPRTLNVVMLGLLAGLDFLPFVENALARAVDAQSPERLVDINRRAYQLGRESAAGTRGVAGS